VSTIEFSLIEVALLHGLKQGNEVLKEIHREMNVESVEKLLEETREAREYEKACLIFPWSRSLNHSQCSGNLGDVSESIDAG
jgi:hypothetical protein